MKKAEALDEREGQTFEASLAALEKTGVRMLEVDLPDWPYDILLTTTPLDLFVGSLQGEVPDTVREQASRLRHSGSYIVGVGVQKKLLDIHKRAPLKEWTSAL